MPIFTTLVSGSGAHNSTIMHNHVGSAITGSIQVFSGSDIAVPMTFKAVDITGSIAGSGNIITGGDIFTFAKTGNGTELVWEAITLQKGVENPLVTVKGDLRVGGNDIQDSGGSAAISFDGNQNATFPKAGELTVTIGDDSDGNDRRLTFGHSTLKTSIGIYDSADVFAINTDEFFESGNDLEIDASGNVTIGNGNLIVDGGEIQGSQTNNGALKLYANGDVKVEIDSNNDNVNPPRKFRVQANNESDKFTVDETGGTHVFGELVVSGSGQSKFAGDLLVEDNFEVQDNVILGSSAADTLTVNAAASFPGSITGDVDIDDKIRHNGDTNTQIRFAGNDKISFEAGGLAMQLWNAGSGLDDGEPEVVINEQGQSHDFRVETSAGDNATHTLFVDGSTGKVGIGYGNGGSLESDSKLNLKGYMTIKDPNSSDIILQLTGYEDDGQINLLANGVLKTQLNTTGSSFFGGNIKVGGDVIENSEGETTITLNADQKVGIGPNPGGGSWPSYMLDVNGDIRVRGNDIRNSNGDATITMDGSQNVTLPGGNLTFGKDQHAEIQIEDVTGTDASGKTLQVQAGAGTGQGNGGSITFKVSPATADSDADSNPHVDALKVRYDGKVHVGSTGNPSAKLTIDDQVVNANTGVGNPQNYHLMLKADQASNGVGAGLAFTVASDEDDVGGAIIFTRTDSESKGELEFYTKQSTVDSANPVLALTLTDTGKMKVAGNVIQASDGGDTITMDTSDNVTIGNELTVGGNNIKDNGGASVAVFDGEGNIIFPGHGMSTASISTQTSTSYSDDNYWVKIAVAEFPANNLASAGALIVVTAAPRMNSSFDNMAMPKTAYIHVLHDRNASHAPRFTVQFIDSTSQTDPAWAPNDFVITYDSVSEASIYVKAPQFNSNTDMKFYTSIIAGSHKDATFNGKWKLTSGESWASSFTSLGTDQIAVLGATMLGEVHTDFVKSATSNITIDAVGDIILSADGDQITMDDGQGSTRFTFNLDSTPELDVVGNFKLDGGGTVEIESTGDMTLDSSGDIIVDAATDILLDAGGDITLDAAGDDIIFKDAGSTRFTFNLDSTPELDVAGDFTIDCTGDIILDSATDIITLKGNGSTFCTFSDEGTGFAIDLEAPRAGGADNYMANIKNTTANSQADVLKIDMSYGSAPTSSNMFIGFFTGAGRAGRIAGDGSGGISILDAFTGAHPSVMLTSQATKKGLIVQSTGEMWAKSDISVGVDTGIPKVELTSTSNSKKVYGVISKIHNASHDLEEYGYQGYTSRWGVESTEAHVVINSLGEGQVLVTNINGDIENGDYISSSNIPGYGQKQDDDVLRSCTVAKCVENIDWDSVTETIEHDGAAHKIYLAACTYHCG